MYICITPDKEHKKVFRDIPVLGWMSSEQYCA